VGNSCESVFVSRGVAAQPLASRLDGHALLGSNADAASNRRAPRK
jgi:hypothetical protein